jgi:L-ascorbate metabolism protein UlaG (beta-lactamase superfamily)
MIEPVLSGDAFLASVHAGHNLPGFRLWWLGQSGFLVQWDGRHALLDPYLSDSLTKKYENTDKPHVRMTRRVVDPSRLDFIDVVTSSHNHTDHLDAETLLPLMRVNPALSLVIPEANRAFVAERLCCGRSLPIGCDGGQTVTAGGFTFHGIASAHETVDRDEEGRAKYLGYIVEFGGFRIYHSGDTMLYEGMVDRLKPWRVDVALLPINGAAPERRVAGNLNGREAAQLAHAIGARVVVPCHYEMFTFNTASPEEFVTECARIGQPYSILRNGGVLDSNDCSWH